MTVGRTAAASCSLADALTIPSVVFPGSADVFAGGADSDAPCRDLLLLSAFTIAVAWRLGVLLAGLALVYSHAYGALDWLAIAVAFAVLVLPVTSMPQRSLRVWMAANVVIAVGFAPWALILAHHTRLVVGTDGPPAPLPSTAFIFDQFQDFAGEAVHRHDHHRVVLGTGRLRAMWRCLRLDRRPGRIRRLDDTGYPFALCDRISAATPLALCIRLDEIRQSLASPDFSDGDDCDGGRRPAAPSLFWA